MALAHGRVKKFPLTDHGKGVATRRPLMAPLCVYENAEWEHHLRATFCRAHSQTLLGSTAR